MKLFWWNLFSPTHVAQPILHPITCALIFVNNETHEIAACVFLETFDVPVVKTNEVGTGQKAFLSLKANSANFFTQRS